MYGQWLYVATMLNSKLDFYCCDNLVGFCKSGHIYYVHTGYSTFIHKFQYCILYVIVYNMYVNLHVYVCVCLHTCMLACVHVRAWV